MPSSIQHYLELLWVMTKKELSARYKYTVFGFFWLIANPILQMIVINFIFRFVITIPISNYPYYLFIGLLVWNFFSLSLTKATPSIVFERSLIKKSSFNRSVIPLSIICSNLIHLIIALTLLSFVSFLFFAGFSFHIFPLFFGIILVVLFTIGMSLITAAFNVKYRDVNFFVQAVLVIWFYATPIIYTITNISSETLWIWYINPMTTIIQLFHYAYGAGTLPLPNLVIVNCLEIFFFIVIGITVFTIQSGNFDDWV